MVKVYASERLYFSILKGWGKAWVEGKEMSLALWNAAALSQTVRL